MASHPEIIVSPSHRCSVRRRHSRGRISSGRLIASALRGLVSDIAGDVVVDGLIVRAASSSACADHCIVATASARESRRRRSTYLNALAAHASGAVVLAEGDPRAALTKLRAAHRSWRDLDAPHEAARVRVLIGVACRELGDGASAELEFEAARGVFAELGAAPDLDRLARLAGPSPPEGH
jgi:hypothetical protein